jgi:hypothetical protein
MNKPSLMTKASSKKKKKEQQEESHQILKEFLYLAGKLSLGLKRVRDKGIAKLGFPTPDRGATKL